MVKLSGILGATVTLLMLTLVAQTQGVGDPQRGAQVFVQCKVCHSLEAGKNMVGPSLHGLIGRKAGSVPGGIVTATVSSTYREPRLALSHAAATASRHSAVASARKIPQGGSGDEVALKVEGVVNCTVHAEEALGGSS